ncbi:unnamed protein product [Polarella glacialis]|uniref:Uncharacterized protein n=1 Tax=Polarella glacialis TaxID=89957 RepID=A0A813F152_POLGL|nr:unnamed protein product [Polarella glacialis]
MWQRLALAAAALGLVAAVAAVAAVVVPLGLEAAAPLAVLQFPWPSRAEPSLAERAQVAFHAAQHAEAQAFNRSARAQEQLIDHISELKAQANSSSMAKDIENREEAAVRERRSKLEDSIQNHLQQLNQIVQAQEAMRDSAAAKLQVMYVDRKAKKSAEELTRAEARAKKEQQLAQEKAAKLKDASDAAWAKWQEVVHEQAAEINKVMDDQAWKVTLEKRKDETRQIAVKTKAQEVAKEMEEKVAEAEKKRKEDEEAIGAQSRQPQPKPATGGAPAKEVAAPEQKQAVLPPALELLETEEERGGDGEKGGGEEGEEVGANQSADTATEKRKEEREALKISATKLARSIEDEAAELANLEEEKVRSMRQSYEALRNETEAEMRDVTEAASQAARHAKYSAQSTAALARWAGHENGTDGTQESEAQLRVVERQRKELEELTEDSLRRAGRTLAQAEAQIKLAALKKYAELRRRVPELEKRAREAAKDSERRAKKLKTEEDKQAKKAAKKLKKEAEKSAKEQKREAEKKAEAHEQPEAAQKNPSEFLAAGGKLLQGSSIFQFSVLLPYLGLCLCLALAGHAAQLSRSGRRTIRELPPALG